MRCVVDASIWIDLHHGTMLVPAMRLQHEYHVPDAVQLLRLGVKKCELDGNGVMAVVALAAKYPAPSRADLFGLESARMLDAVLLTSDAALRKAAEREGVGVHGVLWLLDQLVEKEIITQKARAHALAAMKAAGSRLPADCGGDIADLGREKNKTQSAITNCKLQPINRQSQIENDQRQSAIANRKCIWLLRNGTI